MTTPTSYRVKWTPPAIRDIRRVPEKVAVAVVEFVHGPLADRPTIVGKPLTLELEGAYAARRGDYRVIYRIHPDRELISIMAVGHRADVYRRR